MRIIYGKKNRPDKSHILIIRGVSDESLAYFKEHVEKYPTWGLVLCLEKGQEPATIYWSEEYGPDKVSETPIHKIWCRYGDAPDDYVIHEVLREFPEYDDDKDPIIEEPKKEAPKPSTDFMDAMTGASRAMSGLSSAMGRFGGRPPHRPDPERYKEMFGVYPGEPIRPDTSMPVKVMQMAHEMDGREIERFIDRDRLRGYPEEDLIKHIPPEILRRIKHEMIEKLIDCENFWDIDVMEVAHYDGPYPKIAFVLRMGIAPMGDIAKDRRRYESPAMRRPDGFRIPYFGSEMFDMDVRIDPAMMEELRTFSPTKCRVDAKDMFGVDEDKPTDKE